MGGKGYETGHSFPFISDGHSYQDRMYMLLDSLPDSAKASSLCESYLNYYAWFFQPLSRGELFQDLLTPTLSHRNTVNHPDGELRSIKPHSIAVLFFIFAIASSMDQSHLSESGKYYQLGRLALSMRSVFDAPLLDTIQAVSLMAAFTSNSGGKHAVEESWSYLGLAIRLATSVSGSFVLSYPNAEVICSLGWAS